MPGVKRYESSDAKNRTSRRCLESDDGEDGYPVFHEMVCPEVAATPRSSNAILAPQSTTCPPRKLVTHPPQAKILPPGHLQYPLLLRGRRARAATCSEGQECAGGLHLRQTSFTARMCKLLRIESIGLGRAGPHLSHRRRHRVRVSDVRLRRARRTRGPRRVRARRAAFCRLGCGSRTGFDVTAGPPPPPECTATPGCPGRRPLRPVVCSDGKCQPSAKKGLRRSRTLARRLQTP